MKLRRVLLVLCPFFVWNNVFAQPEFEVNEPRPYTTGMEIARKYGAKVAHGYFNDCHEQTSNDMCFYGVAYTWYMMGEHDKSIEMVKYMLANTTLPDNIAGHCWALMGGNLIYLRKFEQAQEPLLKALEFYKKANQPVNQFRVLVQLGNGKLRSGKLEAADAYFERAVLVGISEEMSREYLYSLRAISAYTRGNVEMAISYAELSYAEYERIKNYRGMIDAKSYIGFYLYELGREEEAKTFLQQANQMTEDYQTGPVTWTVLVNAYINKCEEPENTRKLIDAKLKGEKGTFLLRFKHLIESKECP
ncbi:hypothetical protein [Acanthopleuribacter pedis]|uniref:Tetratricopeptide repeat protein n=1 Tax=Acanthopleuribacter pedis TaxID=442870 RepID=A0A8J7QCE6_9BACT|nr:hypothetical protein [Acanthopleuribacter pedis]MBO1321897.1 hypothetical protein [Acanthopleuribacter pedis]